MHDPMKKEIEETCQLGKMMQVSMMSVFLGIRLDSILGMKVYIVPKHIHFTSCHLVPSVVHVDAVVVV